tara:strand:- start:5361 stop:7418 length:2058 start_codon:yes stop_codon:yes gene_type:complete
MAIKNLLSLFKRIVFKDKDITRCVSLIKSSGKFDKQFYLSQQPGVNFEHLSEKNVIRHYLEVGERNGLNPSGVFSTSWYLSQYPDVADSGMSPLVHFILFGEKEGRFSSESMYLRSASFLKTQITDLTTEYLWGGYSVQSLKALRKLYNDETLSHEIRFLAAWHAARWYYFNHQYEQALRLSKLVQRLDNEYALNITAVLMHAFLFFKLNDIQAARTSCIRYLECNPSDPNILLTMSNLEHSAENKLKWINKIFSNNGLSLLSAGEGKQELSFASIECQSEEVVSGRLVSVIMPTYNAGKRVLVAIRSLINQSWSNIEIIVVDDCSTDDTVDHIKQHYSNDSRVKLVQQPQNGGAYKARNSGLKFARGDFITTHDSDDWSHPQKVALQVEYLDMNPEVMGVATHWVRATDNVEFQHNWRLNTSLIHWSHSSFLFRRTVVKDMGGWDPVVVGGDTEFIWRVQARYGQQAFHKIHGNIPLAFALDDDSSLTRNKATHIRTMHNGLRHVYRNSGKWWHKVSQEVKLEDNARLRAFPAPKPMRIKGGINLRLHMLFIGDFRENSITNNNKQLIEVYASQGISVGLYHIPEYAKPVSPLSDSFFELAEKFSLELCVFGMEVDTEYAVLLQPGMLQNLPEDKVKLNARKCFIPYEFCHNDSNYKQLFNALESDTLHRLSDDLLAELKPKVR